MGSKDPFNFDDIYKEAGVDSLFVKKSMAEQKAMSKPIPATPPRPQQQQQNSPGLATSPGGFGQLQQRAAVSTTPVRAPMGGSKPPSASNLAGLDDPFAELGGISKPPPMAAQRTPVRSPTPPRAPEPQQPVPSVQQPAVPAAGSAAAAPHFDLDLEDMFGMGSTSSSAKQQPAAAAAAAAEHHDDPFAAFGGVDGASAAIPAAQRTPPSPVPAPAPAPRTVSPDRQAAAAAAARAAAAAAAAVTSPRDESPSYVRQQQQYEQPIQQQRHSPRASPQHADAYGGRAQQAGVNFSPMAAGGAYGVESVDGPYDRGQMYGGADGSFSGSGSGNFGGSATGGKGWGGLLKSVTKTATTLGKKGLKAAQAGLQQLETAIEHLDKQGSGKVPHGAEGPPSANGSAHHHHHHHQQQEQQGQHDDVPAERVLSMAIHISELPSSRQEDALARLPRPVRQKVLALLREQAVMEGEEQLSSSSSGAAARPAAAAAAVPEQGGGFIPTREYKLEEVAGSGAERPKSAPAHERRPAAPAVEEEDLLGLHGPPNKTPAAAVAAAAAEKRPDRLASVSGIDDFFSGGPAAASSSSPAPPAASSSRSSSAPRPHTAGASGGAAAGGASGLSSRMSGSEGHLTDLLGGGGAAAAARPAAAPRAGAGVGDLMGGLDVLHVDVDVAAHGGLYADGGEGDDGGQEPAIRRQLRAARAAEKHAKMKAALADQQAQEAEEQARRQQQQQHKQAHRERIDVWKNKNKGNVRGLLGSLQTVLWEDSGWQPINMGDLLEPAQVRKAWMKANLLVHPDKVRQRNGGNEQVAIADMIFDALKEAWGQFRG